MDRSVMENIRDAGFDQLLALCGGSCSCATCHVFIEGKSLKGLPPMLENEADMLGASTYRKDNSRLSCQIQFSNALDGLAVRIAPEE